MLHNRRPKCWICYNFRTGVNYYHHHISTQALRDYYKRRFGDRYQRCFICKKHHRGREPSRRRILITSSTLYKCWEHENFNPTSCFDVETIVGGTYIEGLRAFRRNFYYSEEPCDILVVMGINNISSGQGVNEIINEIKEFKAVVMHHSYKYRHIFPNRIAFSTCIQPPKFVAFNYNRLPEHIKRRGNQHRRIQALNRQIRRVNAASNIRGLPLHNEGTYIFRGKQYHQDVWKERTWDRKLHLQAKVKAKIGMKVALFFDELPYY